MSDAKNQIIKPELFRDQDVFFGAKARILATLPENHAIYSVIGRIASEWSHLEHLLDLIIWDLVHHDQVKVACITSQLMGTAPRIRTVLNLLSLRAKRPETSKLVDKVNQLNKRTFDVSERRNRAIHDPWYLETISGQPAQFKSMPSKDPQFGIADIDEKEQADVIAKIRELNVRAATLRNEIQAALVASGEKPPEPRLSERGQSST